MAIKQTSKDSNRKPKRPFYKLKRLWFLLFLCVACGVAVNEGYKYFEDYTREYRERAETYDLSRINNVELPSLIVDRNGKEIGRFFVQNRSIITIDDVSEVFIDALIAGEDQRFKIHDGVDYIGVVRAFYLNWKAGERTQGASTITQQLARNAYDLEGEREERGETGMQRKMVEAFLAQRIERNFTKSEILEFYLNRIYFGSGYYGIRSASLGYFGKEPSELNTLQSAAIVGCIKNPTNISPLNDREANLRARNMVLTRMVDLGMLKSKEARRLRALKLTLNPKPLQRGTSHLYERIADAVGVVMGDDGLAAGGYTIHTTILSEAQQAAEEELLKTLSRAEARSDYQNQRQQDFHPDSGEAPKFLQGACLMVDKATGEVLVHVGGRDYAQVPYDFIEAGTRPMGTALFPFIYAAALERGITPAKILHDEPMDNRSVMIGGREGILGEWGMEVNNPVYDGEVTMRHAFEYSKIAATVRLADDLGLQNLVDQAVEFGFPWEDAELLRRVAVGFEESSLKQAVRAISVFGEAGEISDGSLVYLDRIQDADGKVVYRREPKALSSKPVINPLSAWQIHDMMRGSMDHGSAKGAFAGLVQKPFHGAAKGGTTPDFRDGWFLGYNRQVACGVWTGFLNAGDQSIYPGAFSRDLAMPVWQAAMNAASPLFGLGEFPRPEELVTISVCSSSGQKATQFCQEYSEDPNSNIVRSHSTAVDEYFQPSSQRMPYCHVHAGASSFGQLSSMDIFDGSTVDAVPVRPKSPVLMGDDPYHSELPGYGEDTTEPVLVKKRTNVLDSLDLSQYEEEISLPQPERLVISDE